MYLQKQLFETMNSTTSQRAGNISNSSANGSNGRFQAKAKGLNSHILHRGYRSQISPQPKSPLAKSVSPRERSPSGTGKKLAKFKSVEHNQNEEWGALSPLDGAQNAVSPRQKFFKFLTCNQLAENYSNDHLDCVDLLRRNWDSAVDQCSNATPSLPNVGKGLVHVYEDQTDDNCCESVVSVTSTTTASSSTSINNSDVCCSSLSSSTSLRSIFYYEDKDEISLESSSTSTDFEHCNSPGLDSSNGFNDHHSAQKPKFSIDEWLEQRILEQVFLTH